MFARHRIPLLAALSLFGVTGCSGGSSNGGPPPPIQKQPRTLRFDVQPGAGLAGVPFGGPIRVRVLNIGTAPPNPADRVELSLAGGVTGSLTGTLEQPVSNGVATFDDLAITRAGRGLTLVASYRDGDDITGTASSVAFDRGMTNGPRHVIVMVADGWGYQQVAAMQSFTGQGASFAGLSRTAMATWDLDTKALNRGTGYDPTLAWTSVPYLIGAATDSASSATAMFTGTKTNTGKISVGVGTTGVRLQTLAEFSAWNGLGVGAISSVPINHATPAAFIAHNDSRGFGRTIMDEMLFADPAHTGSAIGDRGKSTFIPDVLIGGGHPATSGGANVNWTQFTAARKAGWSVLARFYENGGTSNDPVKDLLSAAGTANRLFGLYGGSIGNIPLRLHDGSGADPLEPTLRDMTEAALTNLGKHKDGFVLMIEGGAVDWAGHGNSMTQMIGEMIGFDDAVKEVLEFIDDPSNAVQWSNTLLIVTGDHETGLLTAGPAKFPDVPLGAVTTARITAEAIDQNSNLVASWDDTNTNGSIDTGEDVYWAWNTVGHSNVLIPVFFKGLGADRFGKEVDGKDPVRGDYIDNTAIYRVMRGVLDR